MVSTEPPVPDAIQRVLAVFSTVKDCRIIGYDPHNEEEHNPMRVVKTATEKSPAVRRFTMQFTKRIGIQLTSQTICWTRGINGWNEPEFFLSNVSDLRI
jgi:hypothetical protein